MKLYQNVCLNNILVKFEYGSCRKKTIPPDQICSKPCSSSRGRSFAFYIFFTGMCTIVISRLSLNMYYVGSKTRSPDKIPLKPCSPSRGHSFALIFMELYQKVCLMMSWSSLNMGHVGSKRRSLGQICFKFCSPLEALVLLQS